MPSGILTKKGMVKAVRSYAVGVMILLVFATADLFGADCRSATDKLGKRLFAEYGAIFSATDEVVLPKTCIFASESEVARFQSKLTTSKLTIGTVEIELQAAAMTSLKKALRDAETRGLRITPLDGSIAGRRSFADTERIWNSRFFPALDHWVRRSRISRQEADAARQLSVVDQVERVLLWEENGIFFSTGKNRPIMSSVAPPGTSQHLSLIAFDIEQASNRAVRDIMNANGWFQTVVNDSPHFTFLGYAESELPKRGLKAVARGGYKYWVPAV